MVESSVGISAPLLIGEESILDPVVGAITGTIYGGLRIFDKIRHKNKDDYSIDVLVDEEQKEPVDQTLQNWRNIRQRDAQHQWAHQQPIQEDEIDAPIAEDFSWEGVQEVRPQAQDPAIVIQNDEQLDQLHLIPVDVQIPLNQPVQTQDELNLYPPDLVRQIDEPDAQNWIDNEQQFNELEQRNVDQNEPEIPIPRRNDPDPDPGNNPGGNDPDPDPGNNNNQQEENKDNQISNQIQQIANRITSLQNNKKDKEEEKNTDKDADFDKERQRYIADIEFQIRSQQSLIDILKRFQDQQIDVKQVNKELDDIEDYILEQRAQQFTEDFVFSDVISTF